MPFESIKPIGGGVTAPIGFVANAVKAGIKDPSKPRLDLAVISSSLPCTSAGTFTTNRVKAACVKVSQSHLRRSDIQAVVVNSGNANACTGLQGIRDARQMCKSVSKALTIRQTEVAVCSTGVIGLPMPMDRMLAGLEELLQPGKLSDKNGGIVSQAIMTSDTVPKEIAVEFTIKGKPVRIGACAKGAGMISPSMATMLCFITTDAKISRELLQSCTLECVEHTFNRITIDGDMSTNDSVLVMANGASGIDAITERSNDFLVFQEALRSVMLALAKRIVQDGERVTKFVTVHVQGARNYLEGKKVAEAVAKSSLVKSSWNGGDPNWGRIIHAVGYSRAKIREELIDIDIAGLPACRGGLVASTPLDQLHDAVQARDFTIVINLNQGDAEYIIYTTDLSPEYVDFNRSEYAYWNQKK